MVHTQVNGSTWDHQLSPNSHDSIIYLKFVHAHGGTLESFKNVSVKMMMFVFTIELGFLMMVIMVSYKA